MFPFLSVSIPGTSATSVPDSYECTPRNVPNQISNQGINVKSNMNRAEQSSSPVRKRRGKTFNLFAKGEQQDMNTKLDEKIRSFSETQSILERESTFESNENDLCTILENTMTKDNELESNKNSNLKHDMIQLNQFTTDYNDPFNQGISIQNMTLNMDSLAQQDNFSGPFKSAMKSFTNSKSATTSSKLLKSNDRNSNTNLNSNNNVEFNIPSIETEKLIDIHPPFKNYFLPRSKNHVEKYFDNIALTSVKHKKPTKMWISAFKERPRELTDFDEIKLLGEGHFSIVSCVRHRLDGSLYALKKLKERISTEKQALTTLREANALAVLNGCEFILQYYGCWVFDEHLYIQTELCHLGSLEDLIAPYPSSCSVMLRSNIIPIASKRDRAFSDNNSSQDNSEVSSNQGSTSNFPKSRSGEISLYASLDSDKPLSSFAMNKSNRGIAEDVAWLCLIDLAMALEFMHKRGMVHMDLRPANCFLTTMAELTEDEFHLEDATSSSQEDYIRTMVETRMVQRLYTLKLGDFGHCVRKEDVGLMNEGENRYFARELIDNNSKPLDLTKADMFSLGASIYELCLGRFLTQSGPIEPGGLGSSTTVEEEEDSGYTLGAAGGAGNMSEEAEMRSAWQKLRDGELDNKLMANYSPNLVGVLRLLMHPDPVQRPSAQYCVDHLLRDRYVGSQFGNIFRNLIRRRQINSDSGIEEVANTNRGIEESDDETIQRLSVENAKLKDMLRRLGVNTHII
mmetsp:Transcript_20764/g.28568  ORF Transcript_20764/g.28568 Transcript_20764/m.28568 type:complete len:740 (+) Transcript_20764:113-2332(+)